MITFEQIMVQTRREFDIPKLPVGDDPLRMADVLREAQILDVRCECVTQRVGILLEMRLAFGGGDERAALVIGEGTRDFVWECSRASSDGEAYGFGMAWSVSSSLLASLGNLLKFDLDCLPVARLGISARSFEYYLAEVPGLSLAPPDYTEGPDDLVRRDLPDWKRPINLLGISGRAAG